MKTPAPNSDLVREAVVHAVSTCVKHETGDQSRSFADAVWSEFLLAYNRMAAVAGSTKAAPPLIDDVDELREQCLRGLVDELAPAAKRWHAFSDSQSQRAKVLRTNPKLATLFEAVFAPAFDVDTARHCFERLHGMGEQFGLRMRWSDDPNVLEWDDIEGDDCGSLAFPSFKRRRERARRNRRAR